MIRRFAAAAVAIVLAAQLASAEARPYYGYDGRNYGELKTSPSFGRPQRAPHSLGGRYARNAGSASRACLTQAARALLQRIEARFGTVRAISTCRPGARIAGSGRISRHASGNAIDFEAGSRKGAIVKWLIANHRSGGTMTYADMSHIHVDIGPHFVSLGSRSGRRSARVRDRGDGAARYARRSYRAERGGRRYRGGYARAERRTQYSWGYETRYH